MSLLLFFHSLILLTPSPFLPLLSVGATAGTAVAGVAGAAAGTAAISGKMLETEGGLRREERRSSEREKRNKACFVKGREREKGERGSSERDKRERKTRRVL